jgi:hypothetical protein
MSWTLWVPLVGKLICPCWGHVPNSSENCRVVTGNGATGLVRQGVAAQRTVGYSEWGSTEKESDLQPEDNIHIIDRHGISSGLNLKLYTTYIYLYIQLHS